MSTNPFAPPTAIVADVMPPKAEEAPTPFFPVSVLKLFILSVCTFGVYEVYWFYKNWQLIKERERSHISPVPRAIFAVFYCYQCFARIRDFGTPPATKSRLAAGPLAAGWIVATLLHKLPDPYWLISLFAVVFIIPVQGLANRINAASSPNHDPNSHFSAWNWVALAFGSILFVLAIIGLMLPENA